jgi:CelD/BcsL family acetyltransferase involved in cellulose biosynthesis
MQTARAMVSRERSARVRIAWTRGTEAFVKEVEDGMRFVRWIAGPRNNISD